MKAKTTIMLFTVLVGSMLSVAMVTADQKGEGLAAKAALQWLALVDEGKYSESWEEAAQLFKGTVTREQWGASLTAARKPLGRLVSRAVKSMTYVTSLPGAPDGEYLVIQYTSSFERKKSGVETVTPMLDKDGKWRVSGYYIK